MLQKIFNTKTILIAIGLLILVAICWVSYRMFMQFSSKDVAIYIDEAASQWPEQKMEAYKLIQDGVDHILSSHNYTQQVLKSASANNTPKEQELVHAAVMQCKSFGYMD